MGKCAVHMMKIKASGCGGIQSHVNREHESKTNPDIDYSKSKENVTIWENPNLYSWCKFQIKTLAPETKKIRKDAVMICAFVVGSDAVTMKAMGREKQLEFFRDSERFFSHRYGPETIAYAQIHYDEPGAPHMHLGVLPIKDGRLCAKDLFNAKELRELQTAFYEQVGKRYGLERGQENSKAKHLSESQYKAQKAAEKVDELQAKADVLEAKVTALEARQTELVQSIPAMEEQVAEKQQELSVLERAIKKREDEGATLYSHSDLKERIKSIRDQDRKDRWISLVEKFLDLPFIKPLWERFLQEQTKGKDKSKSKSTREWGS